jgi:hypothetical protein
VRTQRDDASNSIPLDRLAVTGYVDDARNIESRYSRKPHELVACTTFGESITSIEERPMTSSPMK